MYFKEAIIQIRANLLGIDPGLMGLYWRLFYRPKPGSIEAIIYEKTKGKYPFYFLQIGGNDGFVNDPIFRFVKISRWKGIIVEPQKEVFIKRLKKTYRFDKNVILENLAISNVSGKRKLYKLAISDARWATGLATFDRKTLETQIHTKHVERRAKSEGVGIPEKLEDYITYEEVECVTIIDLMEKHRLPRLDLLQIDTEGYDFEIIKTIDFSRFKPSLISFESAHLSNDDREKCRHLLKREGYTIEDNKHDAIAYLQG